MIIVNNPGLTDRENEILSRYPHTEGAGDAIFTLKGGSILRVNDVRVDSISPVGANAGVITLEFFSSDSLLHIPNVVCWSIDYRFKKEW